ncbi:unnamed protein product, partial [Adineta ricciae]
MDTILNLKHRIREKLGAPIKKMSLTYGGRRILNNNETIAECNIHEEAILRLLVYALGGGTYCRGCILPELIRFSANVSLKCTETFSFDDEQLLHCLKNELNRVDQNAINIIMECVDTCGTTWDELEVDDANYFQNYAEKRRSEATNYFTGTICRMISRYVKQNRTTQTLQNENYSVNDKNVDTSVSMEPVTIEWLTFLHETRCPICFFRFTIDQSVIKTSNRLPMMVCSVSNKHIICLNCCANLHSCPLCNGKLLQDISLSQSTIESINQAQDNLEKYCFPSQ